jgi:threonine synthase
MNYYSTNNKTYSVSFEEAVMRSIAPDGGLFMPERVPVVPKAFFDNIGNMSQQDIAYVIANYALQGDFEASVLKDIIKDTLNFDIPLVYLNDNRYVLELFHGPTMAFKDIGARFLGRILAYFNSCHDELDRINVLVATSGNTGGAVANGFLDVPGVHVYILYPQNKVTRVQEAQFTTLGHNITAIEVNGTIEDCKSLVNKAFVDEDFNGRMKFTSAKSINIARLIPQMFYYFFAYSQLAARGQDLDNIVVSVPCGNLGNITAGLFAKAMGLPIKRFIAVNNQNNAFCRYLETGEMVVKPATSTIAYAMDISNPRNFPRILDLYHHSHMELCEDVTGVTYDENDIADTMLRTYEKENYLLDPHGATAYRALVEGLHDGETGIALETAHPAKFKDTVEGIIGEQIDIPDNLRTFLNGTKHTVHLNSGYTSFKKFLLDQQ